ncbi:MAG: RNA methyltransferase [Planctomycetota bacterium]
MCDASFAVRAEPITIDDPSDPRLDPYRDVRERDLVGRKGRFVAEGRLVVAALLAHARFRATSVLVSPPALDAIRPYLEACPEPPPVYVALVETMSAVAGFHIHRGCLAIGERLDVLTTEDLTRDPTPGLLVALEDLSNHDNVGGVFRNAAAFGARGVLLSPRCCDPLYRKAIRVSMACALRVPFARSEAWDDDVDALGRARYERVALVIDPDARDIDEHARTSPGRVALFVGAEGPGLTETTVRRCDVRVRIPIANGVDSLNASVACAIALHRYSHVAARGS